MVIWNKNNIGDFVLFCLFFLAYALFLMFLFSIILSSRSTSNTAKGRWNYPIHSSMNFFFYSIFCIVIQAHVQIMTLRVLLLVCAFNSGSEINKWYQLGHQLIMQWFAVSKIELKFTLLKRLLPEYQYTMCSPKCIVEIHAANEHFLICIGYYYGVDTYWLLWKSIQKGRRGLKSATWVAIQHLHVMSWSCQHGSLWYCA